MKDKISQDRITKLHPKAREIFINFITECENTLNITLRITMGYRTIKEQNDLYAQGRTKPGNKVTNAKGGQSFHNFGLAVDLVELVNGQPNWNYDMSKLKPIADKYKLQWGGNWKSIKDYPHFELKMNFREDCKDLLAMVNEGKVDKNGYVLIS